MSWFLFQVLSGFPRSSGTLISGLIPPPRVYSGRLKSSRPPPLSPNLQRKPLGLKPPPHEEAMKRDGGGIGAGDWTGPQFSESGLEPPTNWGSRQQHAHVWATSVHQIEQDFNLIDTNLSRSCLMSALHLHHQYSQTGKEKSGSVWRRIPQARNKEERGRETRVVASGLKLKLETGQ